MNKEIFEYIRRRKGGKVHKVGIILATVTDNSVIKIGWSKTNTKVGDKFDLNEGLLMARNRATTLGITDVPSAPLCIRRQLRQFGARAVRYFKDARGLCMPV